MYKGTSMLAAPTPCKSVVSNESGKTSQYEATYDTAYSSSNVHGISVAA